jgi:hypothetical protein
MPVESRLLVLATLGALLVLATLVTTDGAGLPVLIVVAVLVNLAFYRVVRSHRQGQDEG